MRNKSINCRTRMVFKYFMFTVDKVMPLQWQNRISVFVKNVKKWTSNNNLFSQLFVFVESVRLHFCNDSIMHIENVKANQVHTHSQIEIFSQKPSSDIPKPLIAKSNIFLPLLVAFSCHFIHIHQFSFAMFHTHSQQLRTVSNLNHKHKEGMVVKKPQNNRNSNNNDDCAQFKQLKRNQSNHFI